MLTAIWVDVIDDFLAYQRAGGKPDTTLRARREHLAHMARRVDVDTPWDLTAAQLIDYVSAQQWARETRRSRRSTFLAFWRWAVDDGRCDAVVADVLPRITPTDPHPRPTPDYVYREALMRATARESLMLRLAAELGLRRSEVAGIHTRDVTPDLVGWSLTVHGKGGKDRTVPLPTSLANSLVGAPSGYLFPGDWNGHLSPAYVGKLVRRLLPDGWTMHTLRHRFGTRAYALRSDLLLVQELLGHASPATTRRYVELDQARKRLLVDDLEAADVRYAA